MKTWVIAVVAVGVMALAALPALAVSLASNDDPGRERVSHSHDHARDHADAGGPKRDKATKGHKGWQHQQRAQGPRSAWRTLTPAQRARKMAELSQTSRGAMQKWADCVAAGKDDCVRPLPPGLARKR